MEHQTPTTKLWNLYSFAFILFSSICRGIYIFTFQSIQAKQERKKHKEEETHNIRSLFPFPFGSFFLPPPSLYKYTSSLSFLPALIAAAAASALAGLENGNQVTRQVRPVGRRVSIHTHVQHKGDHAIVRHGPAVTVTQCHHMLQPLREGGRGSVWCECDCKPSLDALPPSPPSLPTHSTQPSERTVPPPPAQRLHPPPTHAHVPSWACSSCGPPCLLACFRVDSRSVEGMGG